MHSYATKASHMSIREGLLRVMREYNDASAEAFTAHPLAMFIRGSLATQIAASSNESERLIFKGSAGQGNWAKGPWVGIFNPLVTSGAQRGYYPCYLFREDMQGVYLSLNQGMTEAKEHYKSDAKSALKARAQNFRAMLGGRLGRFVIKEIDLAPGSPQNDTAFYEAGNICAVYYPIHAVPQETQIVDDLRAMCSVLEALIQGESDSDISLDDENDAPSDLHYEDATKFRMHKRIERNAALVRKVKSKKGHRCEVCLLSFHERYGDMGLGYIEAHHMKSLSSLVGTRVAMDPIRDFAVLCANCHRMLHRSGLIDDVERFKKEHFHGE